MAWAVHRPGGWFWIEKNLHLGFDWGQSIWLALENGLIDHPTAFVILTLLVIAAAVVLALCSLTERLPAYVHAYTLAVVLIALTAGPDFFGGKPRFLLPAVLLGLPLARLLAPARTWVLIPLIAMFAVASTWFGLYLMTVGWAP